MKKRVLGTILSTAAIAMLVTSCGGSKAPACVQEDGLSGKATNGGEVLNIACWNNEFQGRFRAYSTDYVKTLDDGTDLLRNGVRVKWNIVPNDNNGYQIALDASLLNQDSAAANDKIDVFLAEADYILKYSDSDYSLDVKADIGLTDKDLGDQYAYTQEIATAGGKLKGVSWQAAPGLFAYRRDIAREVFGTDTPDEVQKKLANWEEFDKSAATLKEKNYQMLSGYDDSYRAFSNNTSAPWVVDGKVKIDPMIKKWVDQTKEYTEKGYSNKTTLWSPKWQADQGISGNTFGFFYSTWGINFTLESNSLADKEAPKAKGNGLYGEYGVVEGPASYYWGGSWIMPCKGTDNQQEIKRMIQDICCSTTIAERFTRDTLDYTNNKTAMHKLATDKDYGSDFLAGQNHIALFEKSASKISMKNMTAYDQGCNEKFQNAMHDYFDGKVTYEKALENFKDDLKTIYADLDFDF